MGQAAKASRMNAIGGFYADRVDLDVMRKVIKAEKMKLGLDADADAEQTALALTMHFREVTKPDDMCKCEVCGGEAPDTFESCPFCGLEGEETEDDEDETEETEDDEDETEETEDDEDETEETEDEGGDTADEPEAPAPKAAKKAAGKKGKKEGEDMGAAAKVIVDNSKAMTKAAKGGLALTTKDLDEAIANVIRLKTDAATSYWELGKAILEINEKGLWKLRLGENGKARYSGFDAFCHHELHMSPTNAFNMIAAAREYTAEDIAAMGKSKAVLILKAAPEDRKALQEAAKQGASFREVEKGVKESKKKRNYEGATDAAKRGAKGGKKKAAKSAAKKDVAQDKITIAKIEGIKTVKLYARPASLKNLDLEACKRAKTIKDQPFGRLELVNGVAMFISIVVGKDGTLSAKIDTRRETAAAAE